MIMQTKASVLAALLGTERQNGPYLTAMQDYIFFLNSIDKSSPNRPANDRTNHHRK